MSLTLSAIAADFVAAQNAHDSERFADQFAADAVVYDHDETYRGSAAIKEWFEAERRESRFTLEPIAVAEEGTNVRFTARVWGDFVGSPVMLRFRLSLKQGKITTLAISP